MTGYQSEEEFVAAIQSGDKRKALVAIRDYLTFQLGAGFCEACFRSGPKNGADVSSLSLRLTKVLDDLDGLPDEEKVTGLDELTAKRRERLSGASNSVDSGTSSVRRRQGGRRTRGDSGSQP